MCVQSFPGKNKPFNRIVTMTNRQDKTVEMNSKIQKCFVKVESEYSLGSNENFPLLQDLHFDTSFQVDHVHTFRDFLLPSGFYKATRLVNQDCYYRPFREGTCFSWHRRCKKIELAKTASTSVMCRSFLWPEKRNHDPLTSV